MAYRLNTVYHYALFCFQFFEIWPPFQAKNNVRSAPASIALTQVSHQSHNTCTTNCYLTGKEERSGVQKRTKVSFGRTMMKALELLHLAKRHVSGRTTLNSEEIKPVAIAIIEFRLSEDISKGVNE